MCLQAAPQTEKSEAQGSSAWEEAAPLERSSKKKSLRSTPVSSPRVEAGSPAASSSGRKSRAFRAPHMPVVDITDEAQLADSSLNSSLNSMEDQRLPLMANLSGHYSLESSGTERYDLYIDRAAAYDKAQQLAKRSSRQAVRAPSCPVH